MEGCPYDVKGLLWRARADKSTYTRNDNDEAESSGVDSDGEDVNEQEFNRYYAQTLEGELPLLSAATASDSRTPKAQSQSSTSKHKNRTRDAFAFDEASQQTQPRLTASMDGGDSPTTLSALGDPLASQASFPFSQLPEVSFQADEADAGDEGAGAGTTKLPDFLTGLLGEKDDDSKTKRKRGAPVLTYQLSQTDYLEDHVAKKESTKATNAASAPSASTTTPPQPRKRPRD